MSPIAGTATGKHEDQFARLLRAWTPTAGCQGLTQAFAARGEFTPRHAPGAKPRVREGRATRRKGEPPSDAEIERGLRERAVSDPRAAEILLRWLQRPRVGERVGGVDLDAMSQRELERLHSGLVRLASLNEPVLVALVEQVLAGDAPASS